MVFMLMLLIMVSVPVAVPVRGGVAVSVADAMAKTHTNAVSVARRISEPRGASRRESLGRVAEAHAQEAQHERNQTVLLAMVHEAVSTKHKLPQQGQVLHLVRPADGRDLIRARVGVERLFPAGEVRRQLGLEQLMLALADMQVLCLAAFLQDGVVEVVFGVSDGVDVRLGERVRADPLASSC